MKKASFNTINFIVEDIKKDFAQLMMHQYANYFCQRLLHNCQPETRLKLFKAMRKEFIDVICSDVGTHPMQRMIEMISTQEEKDLVFKYIKKDIPMLTMHPKGNYALLAIISIQQPQQMEIVAHEMLPNIVEYCLNQQAVCVVNKVFQEINDMELRQQFLTILDDHFIELIQSQFGNYAFTNIFKVSQLL